MFPSLTGSVTGSKLESWYGDVGQDGLFVIVWCNVWVDDPQPNWQCNWLRAWELIWGWRPRLPVYVIVWFYAGVDVTQPNWHKACNENCFWRSRPRWHVYLTVDCNVGADVLHPNWYQDCWVLIRRKGQLFCVFSNKSVVAYQPYWH